MCDARGGCGHDGQRRARAVRGGCARLVKPSLRCLFFVTIDLYTPGWPKCMKVASSASCAVLSTPVSFPTNSPLLSERKNAMLAPPPAFVLVAPSAARDSTWVSSSAMACATSEARAFGHAREAARRASSARDASAP